MRLVRLIFKKPENKIAAFRFVNNRYEPTGRQINRPRKKPATQHKHADGRELQSPRHSLIEFDLHFSWNVTVAHDQDEDNHFEVVD